jgi:hypothetical protein
MRSEISKKTGSWLLTPGSLIAAAIVLLLSACTGVRPRPTVLENRIPAEIHQDLTVSGEIYIRGEVKVYAGATLTVSPGTSFLFEPFDPDGDGVNDSRLVIEGLLVARGEPDAPIFFTSAAESPGPGDWLEVRVERSEGTVLEYTVLEHSRYGLHVHFSSGYVLNSVFRSNIDGTRFGNSSFEFTSNLVHGNEGKGINLRNSRITISDNRIENNGHGIFLFEQAGGSIIGFNLFKGNEKSDIRFGDFYEGDPPPMMGNRGENGDPLKVAGYDDEIDPGSAPEGFSWELWKPGPVIIQYSTKNDWARSVGSFVDAEPVFEEPDHERIAVGTWEDGLVVLDTKTGAEMARILMPDVIDARPELLDGVLFFPSWDRKVRAVEMVSGEILGEASWGPSPADDHRQASPREGWTGRIYLGLWNGDFRELDPVTMNWTWSVTLNGPVRGAAAMAHDFMWVGTDGGSLYKVNYTGEILKRIDLDSPVRAAPVMIGESGLAVVTRDGILYRLENDIVSWRRKLPGQGTYAAPLVVHSHLDHIFVGDGSGTVSSYTGNGALMWSLDLGTAIHYISEPALGFMLAGTQSDGLRIFTFTGKLVGTLQAGDAVHSAVIHERDRDVQVIYGARDGIVRSSSLSMSKRSWDPPSP